MPGSHLCIPRKETVQPPYFQSRIIMFCILIPTLIYLWQIYIFSGLVSLFCGPIHRSQTHECRNWDWGRTIPFPGIHKLDYWDSVWYYICIIFFIMHEVFPILQKLIFFPIMENPVWIWKPISMTSLGPPDKQVWDRGDPLRQLPRVRVLCRTQHLLRSHSFILIKGTVHQHAIFCSDFPFFLINTVCLGIFFIFLII